MKDPQRLVDRAGSLDARLLSALDEPPPPDLLARTLASVSAASAASALAPGAAKVVGAKVTGSGILSALGIGALAGVVIVGAFHAVTSIPILRSARERSATLPILRAARELPIAAPPLLAPPAVTASTAPAVTSSPVVAPPPSTAAPQGSSRPPAPSASPEVRSRATLATEIALLDDARRALDGGDPARARALMDRYAREAPRGQLAREAALLRAEVAKAIAPKNP